MATTYQAGDDPQAVSVMASNPKERGSSVVSEPDQNDIMSILLGGARVDRPMNELPFARQEAEPVATKQSPEPSPLRGQTVRVFDKPTIAREAELARVRQAIGLMAQIDNRAILDMSAPAPMTPAVSDQAFNQVPAGKAKDARDLYILRQLKKQRRVQ